MGMFPGLIALQLSSGLVRGLIIGSESSDVSFLNGKRFLALEVGVVTNGVFSDEALMGLRGMLGGPPAEDLSLGFWKAVTLPAYTFIEGLERPLDRLGHDTGMGNGALLLDLIMGRLDRDGSASVSNFNKLDFVVPT